jgi:hypothetical protein
MQRVALMSFGVVGALVAAVVFLCSSAQTASAEPVALDVAQQAVLTAEDNAFASRADRHAVDAISVAHQAESEDDLGWKYVQLRL